MKLHIPYLLLFLSIIQLCLVVQGDEFVTLWAPKTILKDHPYSAIVLPTKLQGKTEVALQFRNYNLTKKLDDGHAVRIEYPKNTAGNRKHANLIMTLHVDEPIDKHKSARICSTKSLTINIDKRTYHTFIQTDKPIYKPGDEVKFKVLAVDRNIRPFHMNNIDVDIVDPLNRSIAHFDDLAEANFGVFEGRFNINSQTVIGNWTVQVVIDRSKIITQKIFAVQKYTFPLFDVFVDIPDKHILASSPVTISFHAKYPFGEFVTGDAGLTIIGVKNKKVYLTNSYGRVSGVQKSTYKLPIDLNADKEGMELEATITFTEPESGLSYNKSANFYVHSDKRNKIVARHPEKFLPGQLFTVKIIINNWKDQRISSHSKKLNFTSELKISDDWNQTTIYLDVINGTASYDIMVPKEAVGLKIKVDFIDCESYKKELMMGNIKVGINDLEIYHLPKFPKLNQTIQIYIKSDRNLDNVLAVAMTRYGPVKSGKINCKNQTTCTFNVTINEKLMPQSTIIVYHLKDYVNIFLGKTEVETENLGANYLNLALSSDTPKPKEQLKMSFSTKSESKIHLLAFDKRLKSLNNGNYITRNDVAIKLADYDDDNFLLIDDMTSWHECTSEELKRVDTGRKAMREIERIGIEAANIFALKGKQPIDEDVDDFDEDSPLVGSSHNYEDLEEHFNDDEEDEIDEPEIDEVEVRKNFPESWIFETIEVGNTEQATKTFTVPDSMTSWDISAFSINNKDGLAIMKPRELEVKNEFFIKVNLPYSILIKEVLKLDILIYNYIESYEQLEVEINLKQNTNFQLIKYSSNCTSVADQNYSRMATVPPMEVQKVSFFIKAASSEPKDIEAKMSFIKLLITAKGKTEGGISYQDALEKELRVEPIGLRMYDVSTVKFYLDNSSINTKKHFYSGPSEYASYSAFVSGSYFDDATNLESMMELFSSNLEDKVLKLKESFNAYRYFLSKGQKISTSLMNSQYQNIMFLLNNDWVKPSIPFRIVFADVVASLMKINFFSENKAQIQEHFDAIESNFLNAIGFKSTLWFQEKIESEYFKVAFALIPLIKHKDLVMSSLMQFRFFYSGRHSYRYKSYDETISKGINYLKNNEENIKNDTIGLSISSYVHAFNGELQTAQKYLTELEKLKFVPKIHQKCYKLRTNDEECSNLVTAYTALSYMKLNKTKEAEIIFNWLVESNPLHKFTVEHAVLTETIAEIGINLKASPPNLKVKMENSIGYQTVVEVKNDSKQLKSVDFPEYTRNISTTVTGSGFCSVSIVVERILAVPQKNPKFNITIDAGVDNSHNSERTVKVCALYSPNASDFDFITDVFYEIELPSGYVYNGYYEDNDVDQRIMEVKERRRGTIVSVYFREFHQSKQYCVNIKAIKEFIVNESSDAAVRVYDYTDKTNNAVEFYSFSNKNC